MTSGLISIWCICQSHASCLSVVVLSYRLSSGSNPRAGLFCFFFWFESVDRQSAESKTILVIIELKEFIALGT